MKVSVSLPDEDIAYIDGYVRRTGATSRSAALHRAVTLLRFSELEEAYDAAWHEWDQGDDVDLWDRTANDGLADAPR
jgi:Arc/MetJ-type ribon-helix-helix transcriptional regulator